MYIFATLRLPPKLQKLLYLNNLDPLWASENLWGYGRKVHAKLWPWGTPGTCFMIIFGPYVGSDFPNIGYLNVYGGI